MRCCRVGCPKPGGRRSRVFPRRSAISWPSSPNASRTIRGLLRERGRARGGAASLPSGSARRGSEIHSRRARGALDGAAPGGRHRRGRDDPRRAARGRREPRARRPASATSRSSERTSRRQRAAGWSNATPCSRSPRRAPELTHDATASLAWLKRYPLDQGRSVRGGRRSPPTRCRAEWRSTYWKLGAPLGSVAFSADGKTIAAGGTDGTLILLDAATENGDSCAPRTAWGRERFFSPDGAQNCHERRARGRASLERAGGNVDSSAGRAYGRRAPRVRERRVDAPRPPPRGARLDLGAFPSGTPLTLPEGAILASFGGRRRRSSSPHPVSSGAWTCARAR